MTAGAQPAPTTPPSPGFERLVETLMKLAPPAGSAQSSNPAAATPEGFKVAGDLLEKVSIKRAECLERLNKYIEAHLPDDGRKEAVKESAETIIRAIEGNFVSKLKSDFPGYTLISQSVSLNLLYSQLGESLSNSSAAIASNRQRGLVTAATTWGDLNALLNDAILEAARQTGHCAIGSTGPSARRTSGNAFAGKRNRRGSPQTKRAESGETLEQSMRRRLREI